MTLKKDLMPNISLHISFPKSNQDHRLQLIEINGVIFAIVHAPLESEGPIRLECDDWNLILLSSIKSRSDVLISGINVIRFNTIESDEGSLSITASNKLINFNSTAKAGMDVCECGKSQEIRFDDDPAAFIHYFKSFNQILEKLHANSSDSFSMAQKKFIETLCTLAAKITGEKDNITIHRVLGIWDIPMVYQNQ